MEPLVFVIVVLNTYEGMDIKRRVMLRVGWSGQDDVRATLCTTLTSEIQRINSRVGVITIGSIALRRTWHRVGSSLAQRGRGIAHCILGGSHLGGRHLA